MVKIEEQLEIKRWNNAPRYYGDYVGFVYEIYEISTGMKYVGIKKFWKKVKYKPLKGKKNKRHRIIESDWKTYCTSNKKLQEKMKNNPKDYHKTILKCCDSVTRMKAYEAYIQLNYYFRGDWDELYNEMINLRLRIRK